MIHSTPTPLEYSRRFSQHSRAAASALALAAAVLAPHPAASAADESPAAPFRFTASTDPVLQAVQRTIFDAAWGDADGDGRPDLYLAALDPGPGILLRNTPGGFVEWPAGPVTSDSAQRAGAAWADFDNDGRLDLFVVNAYGETDFLYRNDPQAGFVPVPGPATTTPTIGISAVWIDFNKDGLLDLFVTTGGGSGEQPNFLYRNSGNGQFVPVTDDPVATEVRYSHGAAFGDFSGDGWPDLAVANTYGSGSLFRNRGNGTFESLADTPEAPQLPPVGSTIPVWADFDNDGDLDLFWVTGNSPAYSYRNDDGRLVLNQRPPLDGDSGPCAGAVAVDFDNDGALDIAVSSRDGNHFIYRNTGAGEFQRLDRTALGIASIPANGLAAADVDLDGDVDLLFANWPAAGVSLYRNDSSTNHWFHLRLRGGSSNAQGIGARVFATAATQPGQVTRQLRQIGGNDGAGSQEPVAHFGLGAATTIDSLRVEWPSGIVQTLTNIPADQLLTLTEPGTEFAFNGPPALNRQTGLFEHRVRFTPLPFPTNHQVRITIPNLPAGTRWNEATGTNDAGPYLDLLPTPAPRVAVPLVFTFYHPTRSPIPIPDYRAESGPWPAPTPPEGSLLAIDRTVPLPDGSVLVEFRSSPGSRYAVESSPDLAQWTPAPGTFVAGGTRTQWIDAGPPSTPSAPEAGKARFYRILKISTP